MKFIKQIHLWLSVPFGIIITLICFSGAMLIFEPEITRAVQHDVYYVADASGQPKEIGELMESVKANLPDSVEITGVTVYPDRDRTYQVNLSKPKRAAMFVDQYTGKVTGKTDRLSFFSAMFKLHRWLLDSANPHGDGVKVGKLLVGISTLIFVIALITGVIIWWPRARKAFKKVTSIHFKQGWMVFWKSLHVAGGMYALIFVLAMALTGLTWSFDWYRTAFYAVCGVEHTPREMGGGGGGKGSGKGGEGRGEGRHGGEGRGEGRHGGESRGEGRHGGESRGEGRHGGEGRGEGHGDWHHGEGGEGRGEGHHGGSRRSPFGRWQVVYEQLNAQNPGAASITIGKETASVTLGTTGNGRASDKYTYNRRSGEITPESKYADAKGADVLRGWIYAIHTGGWGGIVTRILWFLTALLGASLPLTGYYIWIKHLCRKKSTTAKA